MGESFERGDYNIEGEGSSKPPWIRLGVNVDQVVGKKIEPGLSKDKVLGWEGLTHGSTAADPGKTPSKNRGAGCPRARTYPRRRRSECNRLLGTLLIQCFGWVAAYRESC